MDGICSCVNIDGDRWLHSIQVVVAMVTNKNADDFIFRWFVSYSNTDEQSTSYTAKKVSEVVAGMGDNGPPVEDVKNLWLL